MTVRTIDGQIMDLRGLPKSAMLLFWNPGCGFCQQMLEGVKRWEAFGGGKKLNLVIVSSGAETAVRAQGFASQVIHDEDGSVMRIFNAAGTPSAVLITDGRVASKVEAGAHGVWGLAGVRQAVPA
jgi:hypothetical protein